MTTQHIGLIFASPVLPSPTVRANRTVRIKAPRCSQIKVISFSAGYTPGDGDLDVFSGTMPYLWSDLFANRGSSGFIAPLAFESGPMTHVENRIVTPNSGAEINQDFTFQVRTLGDSSNDNKSPCGILEIPNGWQLLISLVLEFS